MNISDFSSSQEFKNFTHKLASNSNGKIKAGMLQNAFANTFNFTHPKDMFNHLDGIYNTPFNISCINGTDDVLIEFIGRSDFPERFKKAFTLSNKKQRAELTAFFSKHTNIPFVKFTNALEPALNKLFKIFDVTKLQTLKEHKTISSVLRKLGDAGYTSEFNDAVFESEIYHTLNQAIIKSGTYNLFDNFTYLSGLLSIGHESNPYTLSQQNAYNVLSHFVGYVIEKEDKLNLAGKSTSEQALTMAQTLKKHAIDFLLYSINESNIANALEANIAELKSLTEIISKKTEEEKAALRSNKQNTEDKIKDLNEKMFFNLRELYLNTDPTGA